MSEQYSYVAQLVPNNYNKAMLYFPLFDRNYICVSRHDVHIEPQWTSSHIYIGPIWENVVFPESSPFLIAKDYKKFLEQAKKDYGGLKNLFAAAPTGKFKIFVSHRQITPFILYFLMQVDQTFNLTDEMVSILLKKTRERFWIWDRQKLDLNLQMYKQFKKLIGTIPDEDLLLSADDVQKLPIEYMLLFYVFGKVTKIDLLTKLQSLKPYFVSMSVVHSVRSALEIVMNDSRVLKAYNNTDIDSIEDVASELEKDPLLKKLFVDGVDVDDEAWMDQNIGQIKDLFLLIKNFDLDANDKFPGAEEVEAMYELFYGQNKEAALDSLLDKDGFNLHELKFFKEYHNKVNTTLINYLSVKKINEEA